MKVSGGCRTSPVDMCSKDQLTPRSGGFVCFWEPPAQLHGWNPFPFHQASHGAVGIGLGWSLGWRERAFVWGPRITADGQRVEPYLEDLEVYSPYSGNLVVQTSNVKTGSCSTSLVLSDTVGDTLLFRTHPLDDTSPQCL